MSEFERFAGLVGDEGLEKMRKAKVLLFGVGGVGGYAAEALVRCGLGSLVVTDGDIVSQSNLNRQIIALTSTVGRYKAEVFAERAKEIDPEAIVTANCVFFNAETADSFDFSSYDYVIDAVDDVWAKTEIIVRATAAGVPVISAMGAGNKLDPSLFRVADISDTKVCPLAKTMRKKLKERGVFHCKTVFSTEVPVVRGTPPFSAAFVPSVAGLLLAGEIVRYITGVSAGKSGV